MKAVCWKMDRKKEFEDIWSEVFEKWVLQAQKQMPQNIGNWIYTVTKNHIIKKYWSKENYISIDEYEIEVVENIQWNDTSALAHLDAAMRQLKPTHRECLQWFYLEGLSYKAIAEKTLETENKIKSCLQNAKRNLLKILQSILKLEQ
ncbi:MAG: sigma-70 family RNA polymerase sigma factor [Bacteroidales bacterium]|nr:sigma-70 family RNA polymerase sigma factor [Bacteroidales bacterium]